jgi:hypothetical protein
MRGLITVSYFVTVVSYNLKIVYSFNHIKDIKTSQEQLTSILISILSIS